MRDLVSLVAVVVRARHLDDGIKSAGEAVDPSTAVVLMVDCHPGLAEAIVGLVQQQQTAPVVCVAGTTHLVAGRIHVVVGAAELDETRACVTPVEPIESAQRFYASLARWPGARLVVPNYPAAAGGLLAEGEILEMLADSPMLFGELDRDLRLLRYSGRNQRLAAQIGKRIIDGMPTFRARLPVYRRVLSGEIIDMAGVQIGQRIFDLQYRPSRRPTNPDGMLVVGFDVTERELAQRHLQRLANVLDALPLGVVLMRRVGPQKADLLIEQVLADFRGHFPIPGESLVGRRVGEAVPEWAVAKLVDAAAEVLDTRRSVRVTQEVRSASTPPQVLSGLFSWLAHDLVVATFEDVTAVTRAREQRVRSDRLEAMGRLAAGVAHSLNSLLATAMLTLRELPPSAPVEIIVEAAKRAEGLIAQLLALSRQRPVAPCRVDVVSFLEEDASMLRNVLGRSTHLELRVPATPCYVEIDPAALRQAVICLLANARDAIEGPGHVTLRVHRDADGVRLDVADSGSGMDAETLARCFEPYFTRRNEPGAGLGLAVVRGIVEQARGTVELASSPDGTIASIRLPLGEAPDITTRRAPARPKAPPVRPMTAGRRILVVEDEPLLRRSLRATLTRAGYTVDLAEDGVEALEMLADGPLPDVVLTDILMPRLDGPGLVEVMQREMPAVPIVLMTGFADRRLLQDNPLLAHRPLLRKPFEPDLLIELIDEAMAQPSAELTD